MFRSFLLLVVFAIGLLQCRADGAEGPSDDKTLAIIGATVIPMDSDRALADHTVVIKGDRIIAVGPRSDVEIPENAVRIDGSGRYLVPGFAEMHGHIPSPDQSPEFIEDVLFMYVANGVTTVRGMLGFPGQLELKERVGSGELMGPTLYLAGPGFSGQTVGSAEEAEAKARRQFEEGWDLIKVYPGLSVETYDRMADTANELGMRFGGHVPEAVGLLHALEKGQETFDHMDGYTAYLGSETREVTDDELRAIARKTKEAGAWVVPTMALWESLWGVADPDVLTSYDELKYMPPDMVRNWTNRARQGGIWGDENSAVRVIATRMRLLKILQEEGAGILFGTDAPQVFSVPGFSVHHETKRMIDVGLTPYEILVSGTRNVGTYFADEDDFGTIATGKRADMVLVEVDPLADISNLRSIAGVVVRGRWMSAEEINERLTRIANRYQ